MFVAYTVNLAALFRQLLQAHACSGPRVQPASGTLTAPKYCAECQALRGWIQAYCLDSICVVTVMQTCSAIGDSVTFPTPGALAATASCVRQDQETFLEGIDGDLHWSVGFNVVVVTNHCLSDAIVHSTVVLIICFKTTG